MDTITAYKAKTKSGNYVYIPEATKVSENFLLGDKKLSTASNDLLELKEKLDQEISSLENVLIEDIVQDNLSTSFTILSNLNNLQKQLIDLSVSITPREIEDVYDSDAAKEFLDNLSSVLTSDPRISDFVPSELDLSEIEARYQLSVDEIFSHLNNNDLNLDLEFGSKKRNLSKLKARSDADDRSSAKTSLDGHCKENIESIKQAKNALKNTYKEKRNILKRFSRDFRIQFDMGYSLGRSIFYDFEIIKEQIKKAESLYRRLAKKNEEDKIHQSLPEGFDIEKNECCGEFYVITNWVIGLKRKIEALYRDWDLPYYALGVWNAIYFHGSSRDPIDNLEKIYNKYECNLSEYYYLVFNKFDDLISYINKKQNACHKLLQNDSLPTDAVLSEVENVESLLDKVLNDKESLEREANNGLNSIINFFLNETDDISNEGKSIASNDLLESLVRAVTSSVSDLANLHADCHSDVCEIYFHVNPPEAQDLVEIRYGSSKKKIQGGIPSGNSTEEYKFKEWDWENVDFTKTIVDIHGKWDRNYILHLYKCENGSEKFWKDIEITISEDEDDPMRIEFDDDEKYYQSLAPRGFVLKSYIDITDFEKKVVYEEAVLFIEALPSPCFLNELKTISFITQNSSNPTSTIKVYYYNATMSNLGTLSFTMWKEPIKHRNLGTIYFASYSSLNVNIPKDSWDSSIYQYYIEKYGKEPDETTYVSKISLKEPNIPSSVTVDDCLNPEKHFDTENKYPWTIVLEFTEEEDSSSGEPIVIRYFRDKEDDTPIKTEELDRGDIPNPPEMEDVDIGGITYGCVGWKNVENDSTIDLSLPIEESIDVYADYDVKE